MICPLKTLASKIQTKTNAITLIIIDINAPIPQCFAVRGFSFLQHKNRINPASGKKKDNTPSPTLPLSIEESE